MWLLFGQTHAPHIMWQKQKLEYSQYSCSKIRVTQPIKVKAIWLLEVSPSVFNKNKSLEQEPWWGISNCWKSPVNGKSSDWEDIKYV